MRSNQNITEIIRLASICSVALPLVFYFVKIKYVSKAVHLIGIITIASAISDLGAFILFSQGQSTIVLFNSYYVILFLLLTWFYYEILLTRSGKTTIITGLIIYAISFILITLYVQGFLEYQTFMWTLTGMMMIIFSISYFLYLFSARTTITNYELLWINSGVLLYFSLNLFLFVISSYILTQLDPEISLLIWSFHNVNNIMKNILFAFGIYAFSKQHFAVPQNV
jgi:hypothetical protein